MTALLVATTGSAAAQEAVSSSAPTTSPGFVTLQRYDATSRAGGDLAYIFIDEAEDATFLRLDLHGHYVDPTSGFGGYLQLPIAYASVNDDSETALGNLEVGGIFIPQLSGNIGVVLHGGLTLPTAPDAGAAALVGAVASYIRPTDLYSTLPKGVTLRLGASPMIRSGNFFGRLDAGVDINLSNDLDADVDPAFHLNIGGGVDLGSAAVMGELSNVVVTGDDGETLTVAAISVRGTAGSLQPYGALVVPLEDDVTEVIDAALLIGLEGKL